jgi:hypothetical protein
MGLFSWFSNKELDEFAKHLAQDLAKRYPPEFENSKEKKISPNRITKVLEDTCNKAVKYHQEHKLGLYKKARLGNTFRWELKELGYSEVFTETSTEALVVYISRKQAASGAGQEEASK